jgi:fructokinase
MTTEQPLTSTTARIGIDLGGTKIEIAVIDERGAITHRRRVATPRDDYDDIIRSIASLVHEVDRARGAHLSVGVGAPGSFSRVTGCVKNSNTTCVNGKPLMRDLEAAVGRAVRVANDANCFALSEAVDGAARDARVVFGVILGTGVGGGIVINGQVLDGPNGIAGEWGHNALPWMTLDEHPGHACYCGKLGCIETFLCGAGLQRAYQTETRHAISAQEIEALAQRGELAAERALSSYEHRLARGLASVVNVLDPDVVVLGGGLSNLSRLYDNVPKLWKQWIFSDRVETRLAPAQHGDSGGVRGAAWLWNDAPSREL